jgi:hypothetical protein
MCATPGSKGATPVPVRQNTYRFCLTGPEGRWLIGAKDPETGKKAIRHLMPPTLCYQIWKTNEN